MNRREFLVATGALTIGSLLGPIAMAGPRLKILMLGGTNFVGPAIVSEALARGHEVTLFNRGITNPDIFPSLEHVRGDRTQEGAYAALGNRRWDIAIDTWQDDPSVVREACTALRDQVGAYSYISSIAVYGGRNYRVPFFDESSPLPALPEDRTEMGYSARKQLSEMYVAETFPGAHTLHRAHGIHGVNGKGQLGNGAGSAYWPIRVLRGGEVLAPGSPDDTTQYTDVRSLAGFVIDAAERRLNGAFNVCQTLTMHDFLHRLAAVSESDAHFTWVPAEFLFERDIASFTDIPQWVSHQETEGAFYLASTDRLRAAGFRTRPYEQLVKDVLRAFHLHHADHDFTEPDKGPRIAQEEQRLLEEWHNLQAS